MVQGCRVAVEASWVSGLRHPAHMHARARTRPTASSRTPHKPAASSSSSNCAAPRTVPLPAIPGQQHVYGMCVQDHESRCALAGSSHAPRIWRTQKQGQRGQARRQREAAPRETSASGSSAGCALNSPSARPMLTIRSATERRHPIGCPQAPGRPRSTRHRRRSHHQLPTLSISSKRSERAFWISSNRSLMSAAASAARAVSSGASRA